MSTKKNKIAAIGVAFAVAATPMLGSTAAFADEGIVEDVVVVEAPIVEEVPVEVPPVVEEVLPPVIEVPVEVPPVEAPADAEGEFIIAEPIAPPMVPLEPALGENAGEGETDPDEVVDLTAPTATVAVNGATGATITGFGHDPVDQHWGFFTHYTINVNGVGYESNGEDIVLSDLTPDTEYVATVFYGTTLGETSPTTTLTFRTEGEELVAPGIGFGAITDTTATVVPVASVYENWHGAVTYWDMTVTNLDTGVYYNLGFYEAMEYVAKGLEPGSPYKVEARFHTANGFVSPYGVGYFDTLGDNDGNGGTDGGNGGTDGGTDNGNGGTDNGNGGTDNGNTGNGGTDAPVVIDGVLNTGTGGADVAPVVANAEAPATLAETGGNAVGLGVFGAAALALGLGATALGRRFNRAA